MRKLLFYASILILGLSACKSKEQRIIILHTNDMHGKIDNFSKLVSYVKEIEQDHEHIYLLSAGDIFSGNPIVDFYPEKGYPMIDMMNIAGYDVTVLGNHEFDYGQEVLSKRIEQATFPFICANIEAMESVLSKPKSYYALKAENIEIFILGLIETSVRGKPTTHPAKLEGLNFYDPFTIAEAYIDSVSDQYDAVIALTHLGYKNDSILATICDDFDVIVGGHTHKRLPNGKMVNDVLIAQAGSYMYNVGRIDLVFRRGKLVERKSQLISLSDYKGVDNKTASAIEEYNNNEAFQRVVGYAAEPINGKEQLGCFFADAIKSVDSIDFAFQNKGGIRIHEIPAGDIVLKTIYELDPFGNKIVVSKLTGDQIRQLIIFAYGIYNEMELKISGGEYYINLSNGKDIQDVVVLKNNKAIADTVYYTVAMNSYMADTYDPGFDITGEVLTINTTDAILAFLKQHEKVNYKDVARTFIVKPKLSDY
jgi:5'-nucleotidase / UDP-sugar diphosphatase